MKFSKIILLLLFIASFWGCEKTEVINNTDSQVGISRVTFFPILSLTGATYMAIPLGTAFTDPGAVALIGGVASPYTTAGTVNTAVAGVYRLVYTAVNADGFTASISRWVAVYSTAPSAVANDLSGNYSRTLNGVVSTWTKIAPGVYTVANPGGAVGVNLTVIAFNPTGFEIKIPAQTIGDGTTFSSTLEVFTNSVPPTYTWKIVNTGYGTALRTFIKI